MNGFSDLLYISTSAVRTGDVIQAISRLSSLTGNIELSGGSSHDSGLPEKLAAIKKEKGLRFLLHSYFPPPRKHFVLNFADTGTATRGFIQAAMDFVRRFEIPYYSVHAGLKRTFTVAGEVLLESGDPDVFGPEGIQENIFWFAGEFPDKKLALENLYPNNKNRECCFMMHIDEIVAMLERFPGIYLLLDLGHLKVSSGVLGFSYRQAVERLMGRYGGRILEIHLSENSGAGDDHYVISENSAQHRFVKEYADLINRFSINVTLEVRNAAFEEVSKCFIMINKALSAAGPCVTTQ